MSAEFYAALRGSLVSRQYRRAVAEGKPASQELLHDLIAYYADFTDHEVGALYRAIPDADARGDVAFEDALSEHRAAVRALAAFEKQLDAETERLEALSSGFRKQVFE